MWILFLFGLAFMLAAFQVNPAENCSESGECAPWLVPAARALGFILAAAGAGQLLANPSRGSHIDPKTGDLVWWQNRFGKSGGNEGRLHPSQIGRLRLFRQSEGEDLVSLYDLSDERQPFFDGEVLPRPYDKWVHAFAEKWPHIKVEIID